MRFSTRLWLAFVAVLALPLAIALLISDASLAEELVIAGVALSIGVLGSFLLGRLLAGPIRTMVASLEPTVRPRGAAKGRDEIEELAAAIDAVTERLRRHEELVERARDEVQGSVRRLGEVLRSTHDLTALLSVVLETALSAVEGVGGAVFLFQSNRSELVAKVVRPVMPAIAARRIPLGQGLAGWVGANAQPVLLPSSSNGHGPTLVDPEPGEPTALAVPIGDGAHVVGVLAIYGHRRGLPFRDRDLETITSLARQAAVGIENVQLHEQAQRMSITDGLTSIWNHRYFQMRFAQEYAAAKRFDQPLSVLWVDIDDFKIANDQYGHQRGDAILIEIASRLAGEIREVDTLARYGGEEFILLLPHIDADGARIAAERVRSVVADRPFGIDDETPIRVTISVGVATYPQDGTTPEMLLDVADKAMYRAKARGKNRVVVASDVRIDPGVAAEGAR